MSRSFSLGLGALVVLGLVFFYKTLPPEQVLQSVGSFGGVTLRIEYATTSASRELGLGGRENVPDDSGMLFAFLKDDTYGFWMKGMRVPLDLFWLDAQGRVVYVAQDIATSTYPNGFYPSSPARYVLETVAGFARTHRIAIGTRLVLKKFPSVTE